MAKYTIKGKVSLSLSLSCTKDCKSSEIHMKNPDTLAGTQLWRDSNPHIGGQECIGIQSVMFKRVKYVRGLVRILLTTNQFFLLLYLVYLICGVSISWDPYLSLNRETSIFQLQLSTNLDGRLQQPIPTTLHKLQPTLFSMRLLPNLAHLSPCCQIKNHTSEIG